MVQTDVIEKGSAHGQAILRSLRAGIACAFLLLFLPSPAAQSQDKLIFSSNAGECALSVESNEPWHTLRLRAHHPSGKNCLIGQDAMASALDTALSKTGASGTGEKFGSLSIGRLIDYPWLSQALALAARNDSGWDMKRGKPRRLGFNGYVSKILSGKTMTAAFDAVLMKSGYRIQSASVEKVLVGRFRDVPLYRDNGAPGLVPYDAQVWFRLESR
ncbi:MAG: hypothetical protein PHE55_15565 [Methylococcaceae bacterium]|nr:hypothetical protein [Methylococcaceae bacterium]